MERSGITDSGSEMDLRPAGYAKPGLGSAFHYYSLALFGAISVFILVWLILDASSDESGWPIAGFAALAFLVSLAAAREFLFKRKLERDLAARRLSKQLGRARRLGHPKAAEKKLTLRQNEDLLREIRKKSEAALVLGKLAEAHEDVFRLCRNYLELNGEEMSRVRPGSPRIAALRKGATFASERHRIHMLKWAEIRARSLTGAMNGAGRAADRINMGEDALAVVDEALVHYPNEEMLVDSKTVLRVFLSSARIQVLTEKADAASLAGRNAEAIEGYERALEELDNSAVSTEERQEIQERILQALRRITKPKDA